MAITLFAWVPLLVLSLIDGLAWGDAVRVPLLFDVDAHVRFLVALPLLIAAELLVHRRTRVIVEQFVSQGLVPDAIREGFRCRDRECSAVAQFSRRRIVARRNRLHRRDLCSMAELHGAGRAHVVCDTRRWP